MAASVATDRLILDAINDPKSLRPWVRLLTRLTEEDQRMLSQVPTRHVPPEEDSGTSVATSADATVTLDDAVQHANEVNAMFERALVHHPLSYKLWSWYLTHREQQQQWLLSIPSLRLDPSKLSRSMWRLHERAVAALPNMPLLWVGCLRHLLWSPEAALNRASDSSISPAAVPYPVYQFTKIRIVVMRALAALPSTQHHLLWSAFRRWCRDPLRVKRSPPSWLKQLWQLCLLSDSSDQVVSEYIKVLTCLEAHTELLAFCSEQFASKQSQNSKRNSSAAAPAALQVQQRQLRLFRDPLFWELICGILVQTKGDNRREDGGGSSPPALVDYHALHDWIAYGLAHCVQPEVLSRAHAVFLARRGQFIEARALLRSAVDNCADPALFQDAFAALLHFEEQLVDCVALTESPVLSRVESLVPFLSSCVYRHMTQPSTTGTGSTFAGGGQVALPSAATELHNLLDDYPLLLNAAQLRQRPHDVRLWLKRVEAVVERAAARGISRLDPRTIEEMKAVFHQSFSLCRPLAVGAGGSADGDGDAVSDANVLSTARRGPASVLYSAWAQILLEAGLRDDAVSVLSNGTFHVAFAAPSDNHHLFGMLVEAICLTASDASTALHSLMLHLRREVNLLLRARESNRAAAHAAMHPDHRRERGLAADLFLSSSSSSSHYGAAAGGSAGVASAVLSRGDVWALALDVATWAEGPNGDAGKEIVGWMASLGLYTAEVALLRSAQLFESGNHIAAAECLDEALLQCDTDSIAALALCEARLQFLLAAVRQQPPPRRQLQSPPTSGGNKCKREPDSFPLEHLRAVYREGLRHGKQAFATIPNRTVDFYFLAAACEEAVGLAGNALTILREVLHLAIPPPTEATQPAAPNGEATNQSDEDDPEAAGGAGPTTKRSRAAVFLRCVETYGVKLLQLRGASMFFVECASLLKHPLAPEVMCEVVLRFTAQLARHGQQIPCRAVFQAASKVQDPKTKHGALFWGAWEAWERNNGDEENFVWTQRLKRNVQASFSKVEVVFDQ